MTGVSIKEGSYVRNKADIQKGQYFSISADEKKTALRRTQGNLK